MKISSGNLIFVKDHPLTMISTNVNALLCLSDGLCIVNSGHVLIFRTKGIDIFYKFKSIYFNHQMLALKEIDVC